MPQPTIHFHHVFLDAPAIKKDDETSIAVVTAKFPDKNKNIHYIKYRLIGKRHRGTDTTLLSIKSYEFVDIKGIVDVDLDERGNPTPTQIWVTEIVPLAN